MPRVFAGLFGVALLAFVVFVAVTPAQPSRPAAVLVLSCGVSGR